MFAQNFSIGAKYAGNSTWLLNKQVSQDENQSYSMSFGHDFGAIAHLKFSDYVGLKAEVLANTTNQKFNADSVSQNWESYLKLNTLDIPLFLTFGNKFYVEVGYVISVLNKAQQEVAFSGGTYFVDSLKSNFAPINQSVSLGLVKCFEFGEGFRFLVGVRATKGIKDIKGVNAFGDSKADIEKLEQELGADFNSDNFSTKSLVIGAYFGLTMEL